MKFTLYVHDGPWHSRTTLHEWVLPDTNIWLPKGATAMMDVGDDDGNFNAYVDRAFLDIKTGEVRIQLEPYRMDPPEGQDRSGHERIWWTDVGGDLRALLDAAGWRRL